MRNVLHSSFAQRLSGAYPNVYFSDLAPSLSDSESCPASFSRGTLIPCENVFEAAMQSAVLLQREALTITQRNVNRTFSLLKRFIGIRNFGTIVDLEVAYWPDRLMAFGGQLEELSALSTKALWDVLDVMVAPSREIPFSGKRVQREGKAQSPD